MGSKWRYKDTAGCVEPRSEALEYVKNQQVIGVCKGRISTQLGPSPVPRGCVPARLGIVLFEDYPHKFMNSLPVVLLEASILILFFEIVQ